MPDPKCPECGHEWEWHQAAAGAGCTKVTRGSLDCPKEVCQCERVGPPAPPPTEKADD